MSHDHDQDRREFIATTVAGAAALAGTATAHGPAFAQAAPNAAATAGRRELPRGLTFATLMRPDGYALAVRTERGVFDVTAAEARFHEGAPTSIDAVFAGTGDVGAIRRLIDRASAAGDTGLFVPPEQAAFGPVVTRPEKIICIGLNYRRHAAETGQPVPKLPILFNKFNNALNHHGGTIGISEEDAKNFDYEAELVIVIGREARNVAEADALDHVFGYATGNDFTARDLQMRSSQWMLGKTLDGTAPVGPWLVTADQVDGDNLAIECRVNGKVVQSSSTSDMVFGVRPLVSYCSRYMTLKPGDIIFTGTPEGVILGKPKDQQVWLKPGDQVVTSIEKLGDLAFKLT